MSCCKVLRHETTSQTMNNVALEIRNSTRSSSSVGIQAHCVNNNKLKRFVAGAVCVCACVRACVRVFFNNVMAREKETNTLIIIIIM